MDPGEVGEKLWSPQINALCVGREIFVIVSKHCSHACYCLCSGRRPRGLRLLANSPTQTRGAWTQSYMQSTVLGTSCILEATSPIWFRPMALPEYRHLDWPHSISIRASPPVGDQ